MLSVQLKCITCGKDFRVTPNRRDKARFCSHKCQRRAKTLECVKCNFCGKVFRPERRGRMFCSPQCWTEASKKQFTAQCALCGVDITCYIKKKSNKSVFCCWEHANIWSKRNQIEKICPICDKKFGASKSSADNRICCSLQCFRKLKINNLETLGYNILESNGFVFEKQHRIKRFVVDAFLPDKNLVVQFDGDYWHGNPAKYTELNYTQAKHSKGDKVCNAYMEKCGYKVVRIWESDLKSNPDLLIEMINNV